jgi:hypothetical protein
MLSLVKTVAWRSTLAGSTVLAIEAHIRVSFEDWRISLVSTFDTIYMRRNATRWKTEMTTMLTGSIAVSQWDACPLSESGWLV